LRVGICISTFRRPEQLATLLDAVAELRFSRHPDSRVDVIVVNNDVERSIAPVLDKARTRLGNRLHGLEEPRRGIPQARNCALRHALSLGADYVAFLDDDEWPDPCWLDNLLEGAVLHEAALVQGRVVAEYMAGPPAWMREAGLFDGGRDESNLVKGQSLTYAATNNLLVRADVIRAIGSFDEWWGTQGGDDTEFTLRASRYGFSIVWWPEAVVHEWIAPDRMTCRWIFRRAFRSGNTYGLICSRLSGSWGSNFLLSLFSILMVLVAIVKMPWGLARGRIASVMAARELFYAAGNIVGALDFKYREYEKPFVGSDFTSDGHPARFNRPDAPCEKQVTPTASPVNAEKRFDIA
jgi:GT2 family glycosyltransferase